MNKDFDCVEMKHKAAEKIQKKIVGLSTEDELKFWKEQTESLRKLRKSRIKKDKVSPNT